MNRATHMDLYQLTSLVPHHTAGRTDERLVMTFFSRRLPRNVHTKKPARGYLLWAGLARCLDFLGKAHFDDKSIDALLQHDLLGPALGEHPDLVERLRGWRFRGEVRSAKEGTPLFAGRALRLNGTPLTVQDVQPTAAIPYLVVETDLLSAKLIETPLLSIINHMTMVASKASRVVDAAHQLDANRTVLEFGTRRTHPKAAVDAAVAAYIAGCAATSNVQAYVQHGVPVAGTMDHFAIQAWERPGVPRHETERAYFEAFHKQYPSKDILLIDTYDTFGSKTGIRNAVAATGGKGPSGIRIDSQITAENIRRARALLDSLGATHTRIVVSGGMDEHAIAALGDAPVDGYGVGERIVTSPDSPVGVGAVAKVAEVAGRPSMKLARGSAKASLPGRLQAWRTPERDTVGLLGEEAEGEPLLQPVWTWEDGRLPGPTVHEVREHARASLSALPAARKVPRTEGVPVSDKLAALITSIVEEESKLDGRES